MVPPIVRSQDPHNLGDAARMALGAQLWELRTLGDSHPHPSVRQAAAAVAAIPVDGVHLQYIKLSCLYGSVELAGDSDAAAVLGY